MKVRTFCFSDEIKYKEMYLDSNIYYKYYEIHNPKKLDMVGFPDGMTDIQICMYDGHVTAEFVGSLSEGKTATSATYEKCFGLKIRPDVVPSCLVGRMEELNSSMRINLTDLLDINVDIDESIFDDSVSVRQRIAFMTQLVRHEDMQAHNDITSYVIDVVNKNFGNICVSDIVERLGYSHKYSDTVFKNDVGFTMKKYAGILRLQRAMDMLESNRQDIFYDLGYYDQAHFIHDFKRFSSFTPKNFCKIADTMSVV